VHTLSGSPPPLPAVNGLSSDIAPRSDRVAYRPLSSIDPPLLRGSTKGSALRCSVLGRAPTWTINSGNAATRHLRCIAGEDCKPKWGFPCHFIVLYWNVHVPSKTKGSRLRFCAMWRWDLGGGRAKPENSTFDKQLEKPRRLSHTGQFDVPHNYHSG
jgi:hypothetical protein